MARLLNTAWTKMLTYFVFSQHCGIYAGDADSYKDFAEVFDPIIQVLYLVPIPVLRYLLVVGKPLVRYGSDTYWYLGTYLDLGLCLHFCFRGIPVGGTGTIPTYWG